MISFEQYLNEIRRKIETGSGGVRVVKDRKELEQIIASKDYLGNLDITAVTHLSELFKNNTTFDIKEVEKWDFSKVENMDSMFEGCTQLKEVTLGDISKVESMDWMFKDCTKLQQDFSKLKFKIDIPSYCKKGKTFDMFQGCTKMLTKPEFFPKGYLQ